MAGNFGQNWNSAQPELPDMPQFIDCKKNICANDVCEEDPNGTLNEYDCQVFCKPSSSSSFEDSSSSSEEIGACCADENFCYEVRKSVCLSYGYTYKG
jgi:hypothetical protein